MIIIRDADTQKTLWGIRKDNGKATTPCGGLEDGEAPINGAIRELKEESNISLEPKDLKHISSDKNNDGVIVHTFLSDIDPDNFVITSEYDPDDEVHDWFWLSDSELNKEKSDYFHVSKEDNYVVKYINKEL